MNVELWRERRNKVKRNYIGHYLSFVMQHSSLDIAHYDNLESEQKNFLVSFAYAHDEEDWETVLALAWAVTANQGDGYLRIRGYWTVLREVLEIAVKAAIQQNEAGDWMAFRVNLASLLIDMGDLNAAGEMYGLVLPVLKKVQSNGLLATVYHHLGQIDQRQGLYDTAESLYKKSLNYAVRSEDVIKETVVKHSLGTLAHQKGNYNTARQKYLEVLDLWRMHQRDENVATTLHNLGMLSRESGEYAQAREYFLHGLALEKKWGRKQGIASVLGSLGILAMTLGQYDEAELHYNQSLDIHLSLGDQRGAAELYHNLGHLSQRRGDFDKAEQFYQQSIVIKRRFSDQLGEARSKAQLGLLAFERGRLLDADAYYRECLDVFQEKNTKFELSKIFHQFGLLAQEKGNQAQAIESQESFYAEANDFYRRSLQIDQDLDDKAGVAQSYHQLGGLLVTLGKLDDGERYFLQSLELRNELADRAGMARTKGALAVLYLQKNESQLHESVEQMLLQSIKELTDVGEKLSVAKVSYYLIELYVDTGRFEDARVLLDLTLQVYSLLGSDVPANLLGLKRLIEDALGKKLP